jgi:serine/threonine protein kinase
MSPELHQRVRKLFEEAVQKPDDQRLAFLNAACTDPETFQGVMHLLETLTTAPSFLQDQTRPIERIGRYMLTAELGRGAMGVVYEAIDPLIGRNVAVKTIHLQLLPGSKEAEFMRDRLFREARAAGRLFHPGIVLILDVGQEGDIAFIAMERVDGQTLEKTVATRQRLKIAESLDILRQAAAALDYAHQNSVVHRDIKPANIMLQKGTTVKIADFGIAKSMSTEHGTMAGMIMGTPSYMSPEQIEARPVDGRSDQFSLAVVAYELLSGTRPFQGDSLATLAHMIVYGERPSIRQANPKLPAALDEVLHRALASKAELRYATCAEFVAALDAKLKNAVDADSAFESQETVALTEATPTDSTPVPKKRRSRSLWYVAAAGAVLIILDLALFYFKAAPPHRASVASPKVTTVVDSIPAPANPAPAPPPAEVKQPVSTPAVVTPNPVPPAPVAVSKQDQARALYNQAVEKNRAKKPDEAVKLFQQAADLGEVRAMQQLGEMFMDGNGVEKDDEAAVRWFRKGADKGNTAAMLFLGGMYQLGNGVEQNDVTAAEWYRKAAAAENPEALFDLAMLYETGSGVGKDPSLAMQLYQKAAKLGNKEAQKRLKDLH